MSDRPYNRVEPTIWLQPWDNDVRLLAFYLLTCEHRTTEGLYRLPLGYVAEDLGWPIAKVTKRFAVLVDAGFIEHDPVAQVVLVVKALERQKPNPNQAIAAVKKLRLLPRTDLRRRFYALAEASSPILAKEMREGFGEGFGEWLGDPPTPPPAPSPTQGESPAVPVAGGRARRADVNGIGDGERRQPLARIAEDVVGVLQRGIDGLTTEERCPRPTVPVILKALTEHPVSPETALLVATETRSIAQSQNRAPNIAGLYKQKLAAATTGA